MDAQSRSSWSIGAQLTTLVIVSCIVPAAAAIGLGAWLINQATNAMLAPSPTLLWAVTLVVTLLTVIVVAFATLRMRMMMRSRLMDLTEVCRQVSVGEDAQAAVTGDDEFALLAASLNAALEGMRMNQGNGRAAADSPEAAILQAQIEKLLQEVSAVGDGDLRVQAEVTPDTLGVLADSFNYMIEELAKVVGRVQATTLQVTNATRRLLDRSADVAQASEAQAVQISQTSESVARLADFVQLSANNALQAADTAREAIHNAKAGQQAVVQTIDGMVRIRENVQDTAKKIKRLGERSQEVGEIVRLIEDIADQTNLLALNAAIQSAMAGEHGRGFAVVADEIRVLAERVTEATKRIATIVKSIQGDTYEAVVAMEESTQEVVNGSRLADEAGRSLQSIYGAVERQAQMIESIAHAAGDRKQTAEAVANAMNEIADITRQTNSATQDTTTSVSYLAELAEQLRASVATFRLPDQIAEAAGLLPQSSGVSLPTAGRDAGGLPSLDGVGGTWASMLDSLPALPPGTPSSGPISNRPGAMAGGAPRMASSMPGVPGMPGMSGAYPTAYAGGGYPGGAPAPLQRGIPAPVPFMPGAMPGYTFEGFGTSGTYAGYLGEPAPGSARQDAFGKGYQDELSAFPYPPESLVEPR